MIPSTAERVSSNTAEHINERIHRQTEANVEHYANAGAQAIERRLRELDEEWDIERYVETMAPTFTLIGMGLGLLVSRKWFVLPFTVQAFFLQHAIQGWCPPVPFLRRAGVRTIAEIETERNALKALRGDYRQVGAKGRHDEAAQRALEAAER
jgi:hypothetical protein